MKSNREDIVKALECCHLKSEDCISCPFVLLGENCANLERDAVTLIKELTEENERLQDLIKETQQYNEAWVEDNGKLRKEMKLLKADTVRKMQETLKEYLDDFYTTDEDALLDVPDLIDQIAKEMLEETNDIHRS